VTNAGTQENTSNKILEGEKVMMNGKPEPLVVLLGFAKKLQEGGTGMLFMSSMEELYGRETVHKAMQVGFISEQYVMGKDYAVIKKDTAKFKRFIDARVDIRRTVMEAGKNGITSSELREKLGRRYEKNLVEAAIYDELEVSKHYSYEVVSSGVLYWFCYTILGQFSKNDFSKSHIDSVCESLEKDLTRWLG
jgi:hypothetical protein